MHFGLGRRAFRPDYDVRTPRLGWGLTYRAAFKAGHHLTGAAATTFWRAILLAAGIWFVTDSYVSIYTGFWRNAVSNTVLAILFLIPLIRSGVLRLSSGDGAQKAASLQG
jgi:hypothetical protein